MQHVIPHWLTKQAYIAPNKPAMELTTGDTISFMELKESSEQFAKKLRSLGVKKGNHVGILSTNNPTFIIALHALSYIGAVAVLLNVRLTKAELAFQLDDSDASLLLTCERMEQIGKGISVTIPVHRFDEVTTQKAGDYRLQDELSLDDPFTIIYTSGTTGFPKGVIHTYGNHWWSAIGSALNLGIHDSDKWLATLPFFHVGGLSIFIRSVIYGMSVYIVEKFTEEAVHQAIMHKGVTIVSVVPVMLRRLMKRLDDMRYPAPFRCMLLGGSAAPKVLLEQAKTKHVPVFQSYGMTETSSQIVTLSPEDALNKIGSSGKSLFPAQVNIHNKDIDSIGEIYVRGPMVTSGYYNKNVETEKAITNGWLATGDLGYMDDDGFLFIIDRRKDLIISGGENIYPSEVEDALLKIAEIEEAGVVGVEHEEWGKVPVACIVTKDKNITREYIMESIKKSLANYKIPKKYYLIDNLPRNASKKIMRAALLDNVKQSDMIV